MASEARQLALPGLSKDVRQQPARRLMPKSATLAERAFADQLIDAWNAAFKGHGVRANKARGNYQTARRLWHWLNSPDNDGDPPMTAGDVRKAIELYSRNDWTLKKCGGQFRDFRSFIDGAPDIIDKYLAQADVRRGQGSPEHTDRSRAADYARELLARDGLGSLATRAADLNESIADHVNGSIAYWRAHPPKSNDQRRQEAQHQRHLAIVRQWESLDAHALAEYLQRAGRGFAAWRERPVSTLQEDINLRDAIGMALMLRSGTK